MLEELARNKRLGSFDEIKHVLFSILIPGKNQSVANLIEHSISTKFSIGVSIHGILALLKYLEFVDIKDGKVIVNRKNFDPVLYSSPEEYFLSNHFAKVLFEKLSETENSASFFTHENLKYDHVKACYYLRESHIALKYFSIRNLFLSLKLFQPSVYSKNTLILNPEFNNLFNKTIISKLLNENRGKQYSLKKLKLDLKNKEELGLRGEQFVLNFEKTRLKGHQRNENIRQISELNANMGYDIQSFDSLDSIFVDRFIEVKTYSKELKFYWTKNEVEVAIELGDNYYLYIVEGARIDDKEYVPLIIQNPYLRVFDSEFWNKSPESWSFSPKLEVENC